METAARAEAMTDARVIPDDLLRQIIGVGQVDLLVGLPTHDHASTAGAVVHAVRACLKTFFPRLRAALLHVDQGSSDGTPEAALQAWQADGQGRGGHGLRTMHFVATTVSTEWDGDVARLLLATGDLLQARAIAVLDADVQPETPEEPAALAKPVWEGACDLVAPTYDRGPADGLLLTQLVRPITGAVYGRRLAEPLLPTFACSGRFAAHCTQTAWATTQEQRATRYWILSEALVGPFELRQSSLALRRTVRGRTPLALQDLFAEVAKSVFWCIDAHEAAWRPRVEVVDVPFIGAFRRTDQTRTLGEAPPFAESFGEDVRNLYEILRRILGPDTLAALQAASSDPARAGYPDALWADTIADFLAAFHQGVMRRDHITQALLPLYRARAGAFLQAHAGEASGAVEAALESLGADFERARPRIDQRWTQKHEVEHG